jgi:hypothetical protein
VVTVYLVPMHAMLATTARLVADTARLAAALVWHIDAKP